MMKRVAPASLAFGILFGAVHRMAGIVYRYLKPPSSRTRAPLIADSKMVR